MMGRMKKHNGFTVVELLVVIVVVGILATIVIVSYGFVRDDAIDAKIKASVKAAGDAIQLAEVRRGSMITGQGTFNVAGGVDTLAPEYLKADYRSGVKSRHKPNADEVFRWYTCSGGGFAIYASLNNPTQQDTESFRKIKAACGHNAKSELGYSGAPGNGYNYAQQF